MIRNASFYLEKNWLNDPNRKPLIIRGARQVGKTWLIRDFAHKTGKKLLEINFEKNPHFASLFHTDIKQTLLNLSTIFGNPIDPNQCLLFLDEIQEVPEIFAKLRWFYEDCPQLCVAAAGSLLEFMLEKHEFSMPVGRIQYLHLEPLSFEEFLRAIDEISLLEYIQKFNIGDNIPAALHQTLLSVFKGYTIIGGMPAVVQGWISNRSLQDTNKIQHELLETYRDDFAKYCGRIERLKMDEILLSIPKQLGQKFIYKKANSSMQAAALQKILQLLNKARLCHPVLSSASNGIPLRGQVNDKVFKEVFLDVGLASALLGLYFLMPGPLDEIVWNNEGGIAEQVVGQTLRTLFPFYIEPALYYWHKENPDSNAEIDYVLDHEGKVIPIQVKAGSTGSLKSLHIFMENKNLNKAVRIHSNAPMLTTIQTKGKIKNIEYSLLSIPFYLTGQLKRLI